MFTSLAAAAGIANVNADVPQQKDQCIDGVNNLDYWKGNEQKSRRTHIFHHDEGRLTAVRMGPCKFRFSTKEGYHADVIPRTVPLVFDIEMDPFESYDLADAYGHLLQKVSWLIQPMGVSMNRHLQTLAKYPPVQGGASFDMSSVVEKFMEHPPE